MYKLFNFFDKISNYIMRVLKITYWKIRYGKRIRIGKKLHFRKRFNILIEKNGMLEIGDNCFFNNDCSINCISNIKIGDDNLFGENVRIYDHNHKFSNKEISQNEFIGAGVILNFNIGNGKLVTQGRKDINIENIRSEK